MSESLFSAEDLAAIGMACEHGYAIEREDPVASFSVVAPDGKEYVQQRQLIENVIAGIECFFCGGNQTGKTTVIAYLWVALAQGRRELCGIELPYFRSPSVWWVLCQTREQQVESTQAKILEALGDWPHEIKYAPQFPDAAVLIRVKPINGSEDKRRWSKIWFHVEGSAKNTLPGARVDGAWADEPPVMERWREVRWRGKNNSLFLLVITATPISSKLWRPLKKDFDGCDHHSSGGRLRITSTIFDNPFLSDSHRQGLVNKAKGDLHEASRLYGDYVDEVGSCPFKAVHLDRWRERCRGPQMIEAQVWMEQESPEGRIYVPQLVSWEKYYEAEADESYYLCVDPSLGIRDAVHDPGGMHLYARVRPRLVARFHDYLEPFAMGQLGGLWCQEYRINDTVLADVEMNDGLGDAVVRGMRSTGHDRFHFDTHDDRRSGIISNTIGWKTTPGNRGAMISGVQRILANDEVLCHSEALVQNLRAVIVNRFYRIEAITGEHDEDMILLGRFGYISRVLGKPTVRIPTFEEQLMRRLHHAPLLPVEEFRRGPGERQEWREEPPPPPEDWGPGM